MGARPVVMHQCNCGQARGETLERAGIMWCSTGVQTHVVHLTPATLTGYASRPDRRQLALLLLQRQLSMLSFPGPSFACLLPNISSPYSDQYCTSQQLAVPHAAFPLLPKLPDINIPAAHSAARHQAQASSASLRRSAFTWVHLLQYSSEQVPSMHTSWRCTRCSCVLVSARSPPSNTP